MDDRMDDYLANSGMEEFTDLPTFNSYGTNQSYNLNSPKATQNAKPISDHSPPIQPTFTPKQPITIHANNKPNPPTNQNDTNNSNILLKKASSLNKRHIEHKTKYIIKPYNLRAALLKNLGPGELWGQKWIICGAPGKGKSTFIGELFYNTQDIAPVAAAICGTEQSSPFYKYFLPELFIYPQYDDAYVVNFLVRQMAVTEQKSHPIPYAVYSLDDFTASKNSMTHKVYQKIVKDGRHFQALWAFGFQNALDMPKRIRSICDRVVLLAEASEEPIKILHSHFGGGLIKLPLYRALIINLTIDRTAMIIDFTIDSIEIEDKVFYYKAKPRVDTKNKSSDIDFGCKTYKVWSKDRLNKQYDKKTSNNEDVMKLYQ